MLLIASKVDRLVDLACAAFADCLLAAFKDREDDLVEIAGVRALDFAFLIPEEATRLLLDEV